MPSNDSAVSGSVDFQTGDDLSETALGKREAKSNQSDYVERGLGFSVDAAGGTVTIGSGYAVVRDGTKAYDVDPDQATDITLPDSSGLNYIYLAIEPGTDDSIYYHLDTDKSAPTDPAVYIGQADGSDGSKSEANRDPAGEFRSLDTPELKGGVTGNNSLTDLLGEGLDVVSNKLRVISNIWDEGNNEIVADVNNTQVQTTQIGNNGSPVGLLDTIKSTVQTGNTFTYETHQRDDGGQTLRKNVSFTTVESTEATTIYTSDYDPTIVKVYGHDAYDNDNWFFDLVTYGRNTGAAVQISDGFNNASRTYSVNVTQLNLQMGVGTWDVVIDVSEMI